MTGYPPSDLILRDDFLKNVEIYKNKFLEITINKKTIFCLSIPYKNKKVFNKLSDVVKHLNKHNQKNILFSPGYPSGDDFSNFEERGAAFNKIIKNFNES